MCPNCLTQGLGPAYFAAFAICILFFLIGGGVMVWASRAGHLDDLENTKYKMLEEGE